MNHFNSYSEIDELMETFIKTVAQVKRIRDVPLEDINDLMEMLAEVEF